MYGMYEPGGTFSKPLEEDHLLINDAGLPPFTEEDRLSLAH